MIPRPQFTVRELLIVTLAVACFFGGMAWQRELTRRHIEKKKVEKEAELRVRLLKARLTLQY